VFFFLYCLASTCVPKIGQLIVLQSVEKQSSVGES